MAEALLKIDIRCNAGVPAIAVRERMDFHEAVVEARGGLQRVIRAVLGPVACIVEEVAKVHGNMQRIDTDIFFGQPEFTRPLPYVAEQPPVKLFHKVFGEHIRPAAAREPGREIRIALLAGHFAAPEVRDGLVAHLDIDPAGVDLWMGTLSKTFSGCGGYIACKADFVEYLKFTAPGFVYSVGMSPPVAAAAIASIRVMLREPERVRRLQERGRFFLETARAAGLDVGTSAGFSVVPVITGNSILATRLGNRLLERGINVLPIVYPAVPEKAARLRFFLTCEHEEEQIRDAVKTTAEELARLRAEGGSVREFALRMAMPDPPAP